MTVSSFGGAKRRSCFVELDLTADPTPSEQFWGGKKTKLRPLRRCEYLVFAFELVVYLQCDTAGAQNL